MLTHYSSIRYKYKLLQKVANMNLTPKKHSFTNLIFDILDKCEFKDKRF